MKWTPTLQAAMFEQKDAISRALQGARYFVSPGQPYRSNWSVERAVADAYERLTWVYKPVDTIASSCASLPIGTRLGDPENGEWEDPVDRYVNRVLNKRSNPHEPAQFLRYRAAAQFLLSKKGVFVEVVLNRGARVAELHLLPVDRTSIIPAESADDDEYREVFAAFGASTATISTATRMIAAFEVEHMRGKKDYLPPFDPANPETNSVLWIRKPHPLDPFSSSTPLEAAGLAIDTAYYARLFNRNFMQNDGRPGGILALGGRTMPEDAAELKSRFGGGVTRAGRVTVLEADNVQFIDTAIAPRDAQYVESNGLTKEELFIAFGTPESVLGNASGRTFDNADAEEEGYWKRTIKRDTLPFLEAAWDQLGEYDPDDDRWVKHNLDGIEVLQREKRLREDRLAADHSAGRISLDDYLEGTGRERLEVPASRVVWMPGGAIPVGDPEDVKAAQELQQVGTPAPPNPGAAAEAGARRGVQEADRIAENRRSSFRLLAGGKTIEHDEETKARIEQAILDGTYVPEVKAAPDHSEGVMVCLMPDQETRERLAIADQIPADDLHVTLAYLGKIGEDGNDEARREALEQAVRLQAAELAPLKGEISGLGTFKVDGPDGDPVVALVDVPGLNGWRESVARELMRAGGAVAENHGYTPHITLAYDLEGMLPDVGGTPLMFEHLYFVWGEDWVEYPLEGDFTGTVREQARAAYPEEVKHRAADADNDGVVHEGTGQEHPATGGSGGDGPRGRSEGSQSVPAGYRAATEADRKRLKIPKPWTDVVVAEDPDAALVARGTDAAGRVQRMYSAEHTEGQAAAKFARLKALHAEIGTLDKALEEGVAADDDTAKALLLIRRMGLRPGSERDTRAKTKAYGATNLLAQHVVIDGDSVSLRFTGKKGVAINLPVADEGVATMLRAQVEGKAPADRLFGTNERKVNALMDKHISPEFKVKDLRTYLANEIALTEIAEYEPPASLVAFRKARLAIAKRVAERLGNTPAMALSAYINPTVFGQWEAGIA